MKSCRPWLNSPLITRRVSAFRFRRAKWRRGPGGGSVPDMAVSIITTVVQLDGNDSIINPYTVPFPFQDNSWLRVWVTDVDGEHTALAAGDDYIITGEGDPTGGNITTLAEYPASSKITIARVTPVNQLLDLAYNDRLPAQSVEDSLDKITYILQELTRDSGRALTFPYGEPSDNTTELPPAAHRKNCVVGFDPVTGEAVLYQFPLPVIPIAPPASGIHVLTANNGVLQWTATVNCA